MGHIEIAVAMTDRQCSRFTLKASPVKAASAVCWRGFSHTQLLMGQTSCLCRFKSLQKMHLQNTTAEIPRGCVGEEEKTVRTLGDCYNETGTVTLTMLLLQLALLPWKALWQLKHVNWQQCKANSSAVIPVLANPFLQRFTTGKPH